MFDTTYTIDSLSTHISIKQINKVLKKINFRVIVKLLKLPFEFTLCKRKWRCVLITFVTSVRSQYSCVWIFSSRMRMRTETLTMIVGGSSVGHPGESSIQVIRAESDGVEDRRLTGRGVHEREQAFTRRWWRRWRRFSLTGERDCFFFCVCAYQSRR